jgi:transposase
MPQLIKLPEGFMEEDFYLLYQQRGQQKYGVRLLAMYHLQRGRSLEVVSKLLCKTIKTIRLWIQRYEAGKIEGLLSIKEGRGRKCKLACNQEEKIKSFLNSQTTRTEGGRLTGTEIQAILKKEYGACYSLAGVYVLLEKWGFSWITSRSVHPKADKALQDSFKKGVS